jgi:hypothetical protein
MQELKELQYKEDQLKKRKKTTHRTLIEWYFWHCGLWKLPNQIKKPLE